MGFFSQKSNPTRDWPFVSTGLYFLLPVMYTQGETNHEDGQVPKPSVLDDLLGVSSTSMDVDPSSVNGETELNAYMRVQQVTNA